MIEQEHKDAIFVTQTLVLTDTKRKKIRVETQQKMVVFQEVDFPMQLNPDVFKIVSRPATKRIFFTLYTKSVSISGLFIHLFSRQSA